MQPSDIQLTSGIPEGYMVTNNLFEPADEKERGRFTIQSINKTQKYTNHAGLLQFNRNKTALASLIFLLIILLAALLIPMFSPYHYFQQIRGAENLPPFQTLAHPLGTDDLGRDMLVRLMCGARISLAIGVIASFMTVVIGVAYGAVAGFAGGTVDMFMMRVVDIMYSVPAMLVIILLQIVLKAPVTAFCSGSAVMPGLISLLLAFSLLYWTDMARIVRGEVIQIKQSEYVAAAKTLGAGIWRIIARHILPNCAGIILVTAMLNIPTAIFSEAFLSFIGLGVPAPMASLGSLANDGLESIYSYPYLLIMPALLICLIIFAFHLLGDALRDIIDPIR